MAGTARTENAPPVMTAVPYKRSHVPGSRVYRPARASASVRRAPTASGGAKLSTNFRPGPERIGSPAARAFRIPVTSPSATATPASPSQTASQRGPGRGPATLPATSALTPISPSPVPENVVNAPACSMVARM